MSDVKPIARRSGFTGRIPGWSSNYRWLVLAGAFILVVAACSGSASAPTSEPVATPTRTPASQPSPTPQSVDRQR